MNLPVIGRFAPSPSGRMHLGNVLCALLGWLSARSKQGKYLLRIEDLDTLRCPRSNADRICEDLAWLGLDFDTMPATHKGMSTQTKILQNISQPVLLSMYQSERTAIYEAYQQVLQQNNLLYPCFCSRAELHAASAPHLSDGRVLYSGRCKHLTQEQIAEKKRPPAIRLAVPNQTITFLDGCMGEYTEDLQTECGDFIIRRSDGVFAYQLAVTVDDGLMGVTEVVRGNDLIGSTARQIWLHTELGFTPPKFYHMPLLTAPDGRRLSKRDADLDLGYLRTWMKPEQLVGILAYTAGLLQTPQPISAKELIPLFSWEKVPKHDLVLPNCFMKEGETV